MVSHLEKSGEGQQNFSGGGQEGGAFSLRSYTSGLDFFHLSFGDPINRLQSENNNSLLYLVSNTLFCIST
jgi:hypothetical protein